MANISDFIRHDFDVTPVLEGNFTSKSVNEFILFKKSDNSKVLVERTPALNYVYNILMFEDGKSITDYSITITLTGYDTYRGVNYPMYSIDYVEI